MIYIYIHTYTSKSYLYLYVYILFDTVSIDMQWYAITIFRYLFPFTTRETFHPLGAFCWASCSRSSKAKHTPKLLLQWIPLCPINRAAHCSMNPVELLQKPLDLMSSKWLSGNSCRKAWSEDTASKSNRNRIRPAKFAVSKKQHLPKDVHVKVQCCFPEGSLGVSYKRGTLKPVVFLRKHDGFWTPVSGPVCFRNVSM